ncbi:MAG: iron-sulfur cluster assembly accessory protein [Verrucomicrobiota bacterium]|nr:iron-sulfur cluster assembly accessory protein [Verrucomicrobiota bacterium]
MITLTERAAHKVQALQQDDGRPEALLRLFVSNGGCSGFEYGMKFDAPLHDDIPVESHGVKFLVAGDSLAHLKGVEIDFDDGLTGKGFEIRNPNAKSTCGCGKSFN